MNLCNARFLLKEAVLRVSSRGSSLEMKSMVPPVLRRYRTNDR